MKTVHSLIELQRLEFGRSNAPGRAQAIERLPRFDTPGFQPGVVPDAEAPQVVAYVYQCLNCRETAACPIEQSSAGCPVRDRTGGYTRHQGVNPLAQPATQNRTLIAGKLAARSGAFYRQAACVLPRLEVREGRHGRMCVAWSGRW